MFPLSLARSRVKSPAQQRRHFRPALESLEDRSLMASFTWTAGADGDFGVAGNWTGPSNVHSVPGPADDANLAGFVVTSSATRTVNSVTSGKLHIANNSTFTTQNVAINSGSGGMILDSGSTLHVAGGTFLVVDSEISGTILTDNNATFRFLRGQNDLNPGVSLTGVGQYLMSGDVFGGPTVTLFTDLTAPANMLLQNGIFNGDDDLTITGTLELVQGGAGGVTMAGTGSTIVQPNATLHIGGDAGGVTIAQRILENNGTINFDAPGDLVLSDNATINNNSGATFNLLVDRNINGRPGGNLTGTINNDGTITKSASAGTTLFDAIVNNTGLINVQTGTLTTRFGQSTGGTFQTAADTIFNMVGNGVRIFEDAVTLQGSGTFVLDGGEQQISPSGASLNIAATADLLWNGAIITVPQNATFDINGDLEMNASVDGTTLRGGGTLNLVGKLLHSGAGGIMISGDVPTNSVPTKLNTPTGSFYTVTSDADVISNGAGGMWTNAGTIRKTGGTGTSLIQVAVQNTAAITGSSGTFAFRNGTTTGGTFATGAAGIIQLTELGNSVFTVNGTLTATGTGTLSLGTGTLMIGAGGATIKPTSSGLLWGTTDVFVPLNATLNLNGLTNFTTGNEVNLTGGGTVNVNGTFRHSGLGSLRIGETSGAPTTLKILANKVLDFAGDGSLTSNGGRIVNNGTISKSAGAGISRIATPLDSTGNYDVNTGTLQFRTNSQGTLDGGNFDVAAGAVLDLSSLGSAPVNYMGTFTGTGAGVVRLLSSAIAIVGSGATFNFPTGLLQLSGDIIQTNGQTLTIAGNAVMAGTGTLVALGGGTINLTGTLTHSGTGNLSMQQGTTLQIAPSGVYDFQSDGDITVDGSGAATVIRGKVIKTAGTGVSEIRTVVDNRGTVEIRSGTLSLANVVSQVVGNTLSGGNWNVISTPTVAATLQLFNADIQSLGLGSKVQLSGANATFGNLTNLADLSGGQLMLLKGAAFSTVGSLSNAGKITASSTSTLTVNGSYTQTAAGGLTLQMTGRKIGHLDVATTIKLGGKLTITSSGAKPPVGANLTILKSLNGSKATGTFAGLKNKAQFKVGTMTFSILYGTTVKIKRVS